MKQPQKYNQIQINLHDKQAQAFNSKTRFTAAIAGVRGGKTYLGAVWALTKMMTCPGNGIIAGPTYSMINQSTMDTLWKICPQLRIYHKIQESVIDLPPHPMPDGTMLPARKIFIRSADEPLKIEGITADWAWLDEAGMCSLLTWNILRSRVSYARGPILLTTTPYSMNWLYTDFFLPWQRGEDPDLTVVTWRSVDNPGFPPDDMEREKIRMGVKEFKRRYEGEFTRQEGLVYDLSTFNIIKERDIRAETTLGGVDWGWNHPAAITIVKMLDGVFYIVDEWYETEKTTGQIIESMQNMQAKWKVNRWYADSANPEKIAEASTNTGLWVIPFEKGPGSVRAGVGVLQQLINENRLLVFSHLKNTIEEFNTYAYPAEKKDGQVYDEPDAKNNDMMDAVRYAIMGFNPTMSLRPRVAPLQGSNAVNAIRTLLAPNNNQRYGRDNNSEFI